MLSVRLSSCGDPSHGQDVNQSLSDEICAEVSTLKEASEKCQEYIAKWDLRSGNWNGGQVFEGPQNIAYISYNGKVWDFDEGSFMGIGDEIIVD